MLPSTTALLYTMYTFIMSPAQFISTYALSRKFTWKHLVVVTCTCMLKGPLTLQTTALQYHYIQKSGLHCIVCNDGGICPVSTRLHLNRATIKQVLPVAVNGLVCTPPFGQWPVWMCMQLLIVVHCFRTFICIGCSPSCTTYLFPLYCHGFFFLFLHTQLSSVWATRWCAWLMWCQHKHSWTEYCSSLLFHKLMSLYKLGAPLTTSTKLQLTLGMTTWQVVCLQNQYCQPISIVPLMRRSVPILLGL